MNLGFAFFFNSILLGVGLAMDAFSVSLANGLNEPNMKKGRMGGVAGVFSLFQFAMPMIGWFVVKRMAEAFEWFSPLIPWIALVLLAFIGGGLLKDGLTELRESRAEKAPGESNGNATASVEKDGDAESSREHGSVEKLSALMLFGQGVATSIDALSVGFTTAAYVILLLAMLIGWLVTRRNKKSELA